MLKYLRSAIFRNAVVASFLLLASTFSFAAPVDINTADAATLAQSLSGIGPSKAQAIVDYRTENGRFASVDDLVNVQGIGAKTLDRIRELLMVTPDGSVAKPTKVQPAATELPALQAN